MNRLQTLFRLATELADTFVALHPELRDRLSESFLREAAAAMKAGSFRLIAEKGGGWSPTVKHEFGGNLAELGDIIAHLSFTLTGQIGSHPDGQYSNQAYVLEPKHNDITRSDTVAKYQKAAVIYEVRQAGIRHGTWNEDDFRSLSEDFQGPRYELLRDIRSALGFDWSLSNAMTAFRELEPFLRRER